MVGLVDRDGRTLHLVGEARKIIPPLRMVFHLARHLGQQLAVVAQNFEAFDELLSNLARRTNHDVPWCHVVGTGINRQSRNLAQENEALRKGLNIINGKIVYKGVSDAFGLKYTSVEKYLS